MTVREFVCMHLRIANPATMFHVVQKGTSKQLYHGDGMELYMRPEVRTAKIVAWHLSAKRKHEIVLIVTIE